MCYDKIRNRNRKRSEFETPPNAASRRVCLCITLHSINTKLEAFGPLLDLLMGLREGLGKGRAEMKGSGEMEKQEGLQDLK
jgi:hypothetical protein